MLDDIGTNNVTVTTSPLDEMTVVTDAETFTTVLRSPLENAITYADSSVTVSAGATDSGCTIEISDDGLGVPAADLNSLDAERETAMQHSRGLGLWELKWGIDKLDGDLSFVRDDGTTVTIQLPNFDSTRRERS